jgi:DNA-binding transcriptional LysR family regulator
LDRFIEMAVLTKVVDAASFAAAARHFRISPAMVSRHVQALEARLGVRLLNRTTRRVSVTEAGQEYYERSVRILAEVEDAENVASKLQIAPRGLLRATASVSFGMRYIAPAIADYLMKYPDVSVELSLDDHYVDLLDQRFDLAVRVGNLAESSLIARKLGSVETVLCASPAYIAANGSPRAPRDLHQHNCLVYTYSTRQNVWRFFDEQRKEEAIHISGRFLANNADALLVLALKGAGVILAPDYIVENDLLAGNLVRLLPGYRTQQTPIHAIYAHRRAIPPKIRAFVDFLAQRFGRSLTVARGTAGDNGRQAPLPDLDALRSATPSVSIELPRSD